MRKLLLPAMAAAVLSGAVLYVHRAEAAGAAPPAGVRTAVGNTSAVEPAACWRRRVCGRRGCAWRTVCRRW
jgi:hypothetical protein